MRKGQRSRFRTVLSEATSPRTIPHHWSSTGVGVSGMIWNQENQQATVPTANSMSLLLETQNCYHNSRLPEHTTRKWKPTLYLSTTTLYHCCKTTNASTTVPEEATECGLHLTSGFQITRRHFGSHNLEL